MAKKTSEIDEYLRINKPELSWQERDRLKDKMLMMSGGDNCIKVNDESEDKLKSNRRIINYIEVDGIRYYPKKIETTENGSRGDSVIIEGHFDFWGDFIVEYTRRIKK